MAVQNPAAPPTGSGSRAARARNGAGVLAALGAVAGFGAVVASSCCVVPLALVSLGAGGAASSGLEALAPWRMPLLAASVTYVASGWLVWWIGRRRRRAGSACSEPRRSRMSTILLVLASLAALAAIGWSSLEPLLLGLMWSV